MLGVTVLTSLGQEDLQRLGVEHKIADQVVRLALLTKEAGMDGVVASPHEVADIRHAPRLVRGEAENLKLTWPADFELAARLLATR